MMNRFLLAAFLLFPLVAALCPAGEGETVDAGTLKQPIFLMCPHKEEYGSWSLFLNVDKNDPSRVLGLGLEEIPLHNSKSDGYLKILAMQHDQTGARNPVASLDAKNFGREQLHVVKDDALKLDVIPDGEDYRLGISLRISLNGRFKLGETKGSRVSLKFDKSRKVWELWASELTDKDGRNVAVAKPLHLTGFAFPVSTFGIYRLAAVLPGGTPVMLLDRN